MLAAHLDPSVNLASRRPETIDGTVNWIIDILDLKRGQHILDLGCGPGLYAERFARAGLSVTGIDYSRRSIDHARKSASENALAINYRYENYLNLQDDNAYDAALLIFGDYCPLPPEDRVVLLTNIRRALKSVAYFVFDVSTPTLFDSMSEEVHIQFEESGFWRPSPHLVIDKYFSYPEQGITLNQFGVLDKNGNFTLYRNWFQNFTPDTITAELEANGFSVESIWGDLMGEPYSADKKWIGLVSRPKG